MALDEGEFPLCPHPGHKFSILVDQLRFSRHGIKRPWCTYLFCYGSFKVRRGLIARIHRISQIIRIVQDVSNTKVTFTPRESGFLHQIKRSMQRRLVHSPVINSVVARCFAITNKRGEIPPRKERKREITLFCSFDLDCSTESLDMLIYINCKVYHLNRYNMVRKSVRRCTN